ncbi:MAG TPA: PP2C family serine/threonine-protein phosphatase [Agitococcus sp.]|nr:PP2C family serine/threonine-protein phosphatase [Agitococcus sp.]
MVFSLVPASVGQRYFQRLSNDVQQVHVVAVDIAPETGLTFNEQEQILCGQPLTIGQYALVIYYQLIIENQYSTIKTSHSQLIINPDPRSLWKNIPSNNQEIYAKPDSRSQSLHNAHYKILAASQRGRSHAHKGQFREDDFFIAQGENWQLAIVADGAGSAQYSRYGSWLICQTMGSFLTQILSRPIPVDRQDINLELKGALAEAICAIEHEAQHQQTPVKDYASTVLIVLCYFDNQKKEYVYWTVAIGDGAIALYSPQTQQVSLLNMPDSGDYAGETRFLSDSNFMQSPITNYCTKEFVPCLLMTDGVSDAFFDSDNALNCDQAWQYLWQYLQQHQALDDDKNLLSCLDFWSKGNHDDRTLVVILEK